MTRSWHLCYESPSRDAEGGVRLNELHPCKQPWNYLSYETSFSWWFSCSVTKLRLAKQKQRTRQS
jgi:hypothetical protein